MIDLLNGCSRSVFSVIPANWKTSNAPTNRPWCIHFRFYDPSKKVKQVKIQGMNRISDLKGRQEATRILLDRLTELIDVEGFNPITGQYMREAQPGEITELTHFGAALQGAFDMISVSPAMKANIKSALGRIKAAAGKLFDNVLQRQYGDLRISQVRRKHLVYILQQIRKDHPTFSAYGYNKYRGYLLMLFKQLLIIEAVDSNPAKDLPIEKHVFRKRVLPTPSEMMIIDTNLKTKDYYFWRYVRIFFRSGSRNTELLSLKNDHHVDLERQEFTIMVKKGRHYREDTRVITDDVMDFWREVLDETPPGQYLFSTFFKPGPVRIGNDQPNKRWKKLVKQDMGINKDLNSLVNLNADRIDELKGLKYAAAMRGHADESMMKKHYAVGHEKRVREELKGLRVDFG